MIDLSDLILARYQAGGRGPEAYDCFGLFAEIRRRRGLALPDHPTPASYSERHAAIVAQLERWPRLSAPAPWCAVTFRIGPFVCHIGTVLPGGVEFIHADDESGICIERLDALRWSSRIEGFRECLI